ncbi:MAG: nucleotidyltransferase family protein [Bacteroidota bacterium]
MPYYPAIILAGGLGTRLRGVVSGLPKAMAPLNGKPFLHYIFRYLVRQNISEVILSVGYKRETIQEYFGSEYLGIKVQYAIEEEPLGTGGGIKKAFQLVNDFAFVLNGDTFFDVELKGLKDFYSEVTADIALALKQMQRFDRYGAVQMKDERITHFDEKKFLEEGLINGGVYFLHKRVFDVVETDKFSFEKDVLEKFVNEKVWCGKIFESYFIDIGIPEDYAKAQEDFKNLFP